MTILKIEGVGTFDFHGDYWSGQPSSLNGSSIEFSSESVTEEQKATALFICSNWKAIQKACSTFVDKKRDRYGLVAQELSDPDVIVNADAWTVYFSTENEDEAIVGVEFRDQAPFQLIIGD